MLQNANESILDELDLWVSDDNVTDLEGVSPEYFLNQSGVETELSSLPPAEPKSPGPISVSPDYTHQVSPLSQPNTPPLRSPQSPDYSQITTMQPSTDATLQPVFGEDGIPVLAPQVQIPVEVPQVVTTQLPRDSAKSSHDDDDVVLVNVTPPSKKQKVLDLVETALNKVRALERELEEVKNIVKENLKE